MKERHPKHIPGVQDVHTAVPRRAANSGTYSCVRCGFALFSAEKRHPVLSSWPAFSSPLSNASVATGSEPVRFMISSPLYCGRCKAPLGYLFEDGRPPTGVRYFTRPSALTFAERRPGPATAAGTAPCPLDINH